MAQAKKKRAPSAKKAGAGKRAVAKKKATKSDGLDPSRQWSLDEVEPHLPKVSAAAVAEMKELLLGAQTEEQLAALGAQFRTEDILKAAPPFLVGVLLALKKLGQPPPGLALELLPLAWSEARELGRVNTRYEQELRDVTSVMAGRRAQLKRANSKALDARRNVAQTLLRLVLPARSEHRAELESAAAGADTYTATVASVRSVVRVLNELRADAKYATALDRFGYTQAYIAQLTTLADELERLSTIAAGLTPPQKTDQRALDVQDGIVCTLMRAVWTPLRELNTRGAALRLPQLGALDRLFGSRSSGAAAEEEETGIGEPTSATS